MTTQPDVDQTITIKRLEAALDYALAVIRNYENDIAEGYEGIDLRALGFCQGRIYRMAHERILAIRDGTQDGR